MKKKIIISAIGVALLSAAQTFACTNFLVGKKASIDGSVIISYAADSHTLYGEMYRWPAHDWPAGTMLDVIEWDSNKPIGKIPQVAHTYSVVGNMNEHQVAITETTFGGREGLDDPTASMDYGSMIYIGLQRSKTAREAIQVMTNLAETYGYRSEGESFSIADKNEAWIMEMVGKGPGSKGCVWVAIRIPDDCISAHANQSRIQQIPFNDKKNCMYSKDVVSFARSKGWFTGKDKDFSFQAAYNPYTFGGLRSCEARVWAFFRKFDSSIDAYADLAKGDVTKSPMPLYIRPNRLLSVQDVQNCMRDHYEGTDLDMTKDIGAGPFKVPYRWRPMSFKVDGQEYVNERAVATQQTGFVIVPQMRSWLPDEIGGILWFGVDDAAMAVFTPVYSASTDVPDCYRVGNGDMLHFSWTSAFWIHNWVSNMAYSKYCYMIKDIQKVQSELETSYKETIPTIDKKAQELYAENPAEAVKFLTSFSKTTADNATARWKTLGEYLMVKYIDGNVKREENGHFKENGYGFAVGPEQPGYDDAYYRSIAKDAGDRLKAK